MNTLTSLFEAGIEEVRKSWGWFLVSGILLMALGQPASPSREPRPRSRFWRWAGFLRSAELFGWWALFKPGPGEDFLCIC